MVLRQVYNSILEWCSNTVFKQSRSPLRRSGQEEFLLLMQCATAPQDERLSIVYKKNRRYRYDKGAALMMTATIDFFVHDSFHHIRNDPWTVL